jgi:thiol-disulfide isomerase/thioredoxin
MKKLSLILVLIAIGTFLIKAQQIVTTNPQLKNVVLEEYTGLHCGYCPDGHARAEQLADDNPNRVVLINIHAGSFATPSAGEPDFRTIFGDSLVALAGVTGFPSGTVNRHIFPQVDATKTSMSRSAWAVVAPEILAQPSPVNLGFVSSFDTVSRQLEIIVEAYYCMDSPKNENFLQIALLESHVFGYQSDYANGAHQDYDHKHILRYLITGQWGKKISTTSKGSLYVDTFYYTVPIEWNMDNCDIAAFITESKQEVYTGFVAPANQAAIDGSTVLFIGDLERPTNVFVKGEESVKTSLDIEAYSALSGAEDYQFRLIPIETVNGWTANFSINGVDYDSVANISLDQGIRKTISINVTPNDKAGIASYTLQMKSVSNPDAPARQQSVYVISGVTDLVINNSAGWGNGSDTKAKDFENNITDGLDYAGNASYASIPTDILLSIEDDDVLEDINNIYYNVGWSFPSFSDDLANYFSNFLDQGGNLWMSGQDIAWDNFDENGYGTAVTSAFIQNYMHAGYIADGDQTHATLAPNTSDGIFGQLGSANLVNKYGTNPDNGQPYFYPDQLSVSTNGQSVFYYNSDVSKTAVVRSRVEDYKSIFMGVSLEMIDDISLRKEIMKLTYDWFTGVLSAEELDKAMLKLSGNYPNPATSYTSIDVSGLLEGEILIMDMTGRIIQKQNYPAGKDRVEISLQELSNGTYIYQVLEGNVDIHSGLFQVLH